MSKSFSRNAISGEKFPLPRLMWADCDPNDKRTPVVVYNTKSEQRGNRPELDCVPVAVIRLDQSLDKAVTDLHNAALALEERKRKGSDRK